MLDLYRAFTLIELSMNLTDLTKLIFFSGQVTHAWLKKNKNVGFLYLCW